MASGSSPKAAAAKQPPKAGSAAGGDGAGSSGSSSLDKPGGGLAGQHATVILKKDKARLFAGGNPMVYGGAVDAVIGRPPPNTGDAVVVADATRQLIGWGVYNPSSMFRVRMMQLASEHKADNRACYLDMPRLIRLRVQQAAQLRRALGLPGPRANVYRLINSEGDRLSGVVADVLGETIVVQSVAAWAQKHQADVEAAVREATGLQHVVWRPNWGILREEGIEQQFPNVGGPLGAAAGGGGGEEEEGDDGGGEAADGGRGGEARVEVAEAGLRLWVAPQGQKTGFYADQRDSRAFLASLVQPGCSVLDLCCYSGGFALAAAAAGAGTAIGVDSSEEAVSLATANAQLNGLQGAASFVRDDVSEFMKAAIAEHRQFDLVVLDPPKLAPNKASLERARAKYVRLNVQAMKLVAPGGILMTCSCSGAMTQSGTFMEAVLEAAKQVGRHATLLRKAGAAPCHPLNPAYPEGDYLTNVTLRIL